MTLGLGIVATTGYIIGWAVAALNGQPATPPPAITQQAWTGACDNRLKCEAINIAVGEPGPDASGIYARLTIEYPGARAIIVFQLLDTLGISIGAAGEGFYVKLRDTRESSEPPDRQPTGFLLRPDRPDRLILSADQTARFLEEVRIMGLSDAEILAPGMRLGQFSVEGILAIHQRMIARQNAAPNPRPPGPVLHPLVYRSYDIASINLAQERDFDFVVTLCGPPGFSVSPQLDRWPLAGRGGSTQYLYRAACRLERGRIVHVWGLKGGDGVIRPLSLPNMPGMTEQVSPIMSNATYSMPDARFAVVQDGRTPSPQAAPNTESDLLGGRLHGRPPTCGSRWSWLWTGNGFELEEVRSMPVCGGLQASEWLVLWTSAVIR